MRIVIAALAALSLAGPALAQEADSGRLSLGGDEYASGQTVALPGATGDAFGAGYDVTIAQQVGGDALLAGNTVRVSAGVGGDIYAGGFSVTIAAPVGGDVTAAGNTVSLLDGASVGGNARLAGQNVTVSSPISGALLIGAQNATLGAAVTGDMLFGGASLSFAPGASVGGMLTIHAPQPIEVPASVAPADRVTYVQTQEYGPGQTAIETARTFVPWAMVATGFFWSLVLLVIGLIVFALFPKRTAAVYDLAAARPLYTFWIGILALSALFGLFAVLGMTIVGIPVIFVYVFVFALAWILMQVAGAYVLGGRIVAATGFKAAPLGWQMLSLLVGLVIVFVLWLVPFLGWLLWLAVSLIGIGAIARSLFAPREAIAA